MNLVGKQFAFDSDTQYEQAIQYYQTGDYGLAVELFKGCLSSHSGSSMQERVRSYVAGTLGKLARQEIASARWAEALAYLDEAVCYRPGFADLRLLRAQVFCALNRDEDRMFEIRFALDLNPTYGLAVLYDGACKLLHGHEEAGVSRIRQAIEFDPRLDTDLYRHALTVYEQGDACAAALLFEQVVPDLKDDPQDIIKCGDKFMYIERWRDAEETYRRGIEVAPGFADLRFKHAKSLIQLGEHSQAVAELREAVTINPRYADAYALLGVVYQLQENKTEAAEAFRAALQIDPENAIAITATTKAL